MERGEARTNDEKREVNKKSLFVEKSEKKVDRNPKEAAERRTLFGVNPSQPDLGRPFVVNGTVLPWKKELQGSFRSGFRVRRSGSV